MKAVAGVALGCALIAALASGAAAAPAKAKNACGLLKTPEIRAEFGADVGRPAKGVATGCDWSIGGLTGEPGSGTVSTFLLRGSGVKGAYDDERRIDGVGKPAYFSPSFGALWVLKDNRTTFFVQGVFLQGFENTAIPDLEDRLVSLAKKAMKRA